MKRLLAVGAAAALAAGLVVGPANAGTGTTGNGAPSGPHYQFNLIGVPKTKTADMSGDNGRRMFVPDSGRTRINLAEGPFTVLDANGTDGIASFQLPNPDPDGDGTTWYSVYVRTLGKPGGKATLQSCYEENGETWCAVDFAGGVAPIELERTRGKQTFENVTRDLLYVDYCTAWDNGTCTSVDQIALFSNDGISYLWQYDNAGLKVAQLRFYEVPTETGW